mmetsp:Transcript_2065/g.3066  ORF Transcript_2065/g.3066 Transcript_2065/m.3066 type:complete len:98 (+) Transcript_2065:2455-2748(+)
MTQSAPSPALDAIITINLNVLNKLIRPLHSNRPLVVHSQQPTGDFTSNVLILPRRFHKKSTERDELMTERWVRVDSADVFAPRYLPKPQQPTGDYWF